MNQEIILEELNSEIHRFIFNLQDNHNEELKNTYSLIINRIESYDLREFGLNYNDIYDLKEVISQSFCALNKDFEYKSQDKIMQQSQLINRKESSDDEEKILVLQLPDEFVDYLKKFQVNSYNMGIHNLDYEINNFIRRKNLNDDQKYYLKKIIKDQCQNSFEEFFRQERTFSKKSLDRISSDYITRKKHLKENSKTEDDNCSIIQNNLNTLKKDLEEMLVEFNNNSNYYNDEIKNNIIKLLNNINILQEHNITNSKELEPYLLNCEKPYNDLISSIKRYDQAKKNDTAKQKEVVSKTTNNINNSAQFIETSNDKHLNNEQQFESDNNINKPILDTDEIEKERMLDEVYSKKKEEIIQDNIKL